MKGTITLKKAIMIDGREVQELSYDTDKITNADYLAACKKAFSTGGGGVTGASPQLDYGVQLYLGIYAILADNRKYDITDIERVTGPDIMQIQGVGQAFTLGREDQTEEPSAQQSETIPAPTTLISTASEE